LGATANAGVPVFYRLGLEETGAQSASATYSANPVSLALGAVGTFSVSRRAELRFEAGYRFLGASALSANSQGSGAWSGVASGATFSDANGTAIPVDASAPYVEAGLTFRL
jgi:hypothetical protein